MQDLPDSAGLSLYDTDFETWCHAQARLLREGRSDALDIENLAEELEGMSRSDKRQVRSRLEALIAHLLKRKYLPGQRSSGWRGTIAEQRRRIALVVEDSPSLADYPAQQAVDAYRGGRLIAARETGIDFTLFPDTCPFVADQNSR
jgi:hypothetical protein